MDYRGARFYDADVGRFLSLDPLAADFVEWSAYNYVLGNPVGLVDPDGRSPDTIIGKDGKDVTYSKNEETGDVVWSDNASDQVVRIGGEMLNTEEGTIRLNNLITSEKRFLIKEDNAPNSNGLMGRSEKITDKTGNVHYRLTVYTGNIGTMVDGGTVNPTYPESNSGWTSPRQAGLINDIKSTNTRRDAIYKISAAVLGHESVHPTDENQGLEGKSTSIPIILPSTFIFSNYRVNSDEIEPENVETTILEQSINH